MKGAIIRVASPWGEGWEYRQHGFLVSLYLALRALLGALVRSRRGLDVRDVELLVLRHELEILHRLLDRLERAGYARRLRDREDGGACSSS